MLEQARSLLGHPRGILTLVSGQATVFEDVPVGRQATDGVVQWLIKQITDEQERAARDAVLTRRPLEAHAWQVWDGLKDLHLDFLPDTKLSGALESIVFGKNFDSTIETATLPSSLRSLTF